MQITCPDGRFLQGIYKSDDRSPQNLKLGKCCKPEGHPDSWGECYSQESDKSNTGWKKCKEDYYIVSVHEMYSFSWRCRSSHCITITLKCCRMKRKYLHLCFDWSQVLISAQCVKFGNVLSTYGTTGAGVPQSSVLGPLLFNILVNDSYYLQWTPLIYDDKPSCSMVTLTQMLCNGSQLRNGYWCHLADNNGLLPNTKKCRESLIIAREKKYQQLTTDVSFRKNHNKILSVWIDKPKFPKLKCEHKIQGLQVIYLSSFYLLTYQYVCIHELAP